MTELRFYMDENMNPAVAEQLRNNDIDVITSHELDALGESDIRHLERAKEMGRVLCTQDRDFLRLASEGIDHAGIAFAEIYGATIGGWVKALKALHDTTTAEEMIGQIRFLSVK